MPRGKRPRRPRLTPEERLEILDAASPGPELVMGGSARDVARVMGVSHDTVRRLLSKYQPVADTLRALQRDHLLGGWQYAYFQAFDELAALDREEPTTLKDRRDHAAIRRDLHVAMAIATEKAQLLSGMPTAIVAGIHEVRHRMPEIAAKIAEVSRRLALPAGDHPQPAPGGRQASAGGDRAPGGQRGWLTCCVVAWTNAPARGGAVGWPAPVSRPAVSSPLRLDRVSSARRPAQRRPPTGLGRPQRHGGST